MESLESIPVWFHLSQWPAAISDRVRRSLLNHEIPQAYHYHGWEQSRLWLRVAQTYAPDLKSDYLAFFQSLPDAPSSLVGLGAGGAVKERWLCDYHEFSCFAAIDVSADLSLESINNLAETSVTKRHALVADLLLLEDLCKWLQARDGGVPRWLTAFGLTPNTLPQDLLPKLKSFLRPEDRLLISANLAPGLANIRDSVLSQYRNPETVEWLSSTLKLLGIDRRVAPLEFRIERHENYTVIIAETFWKDLSPFEWQGQLLEPDPDIPLRVFHTVRFTASSFRQTLASAGLNPVQEHISGCGQEGLWLVSVHS